MDKYWLQSLQKFYFKVKSMQKRNKIFAFYFLKFKARLRMSIDVETHFVADTKKIVDDDGGRGNCRFKRVKYEETSKQWPNINQRELEVRSMYGAYLLLLYNILIRRNSSRACSCSLLFFLFFV